MPIPFKKEFIADNPIVLCRNAYYARQSTTTSIYAYSQEIVNSREKRRFISHCSCTNSGYLMILEKINMTFLRNALNPAEAGLAVETGKGEQLISVKHTQNNITLPLMELLAC